MMCGLEAVATIQSNWRKNVPKLLQLDGESSPATEEEMNYKVLHIMDKKLRTSGPSAKSSAAFSLYEVNRGIQYTMYIIKLSPMHARMKVDIHTCLELNLK